eukprot:GHVU01123846.1.p1 GENE.GHVU01123846.1~~GHVU01123846.1.p1  ORF type:complete len:146 (-),score=10.12 GHVU01123846.1:1156-1593(-)
MCRYKAKYKDNPDYIQLANKHATRAIELEDDLIAMNADVIAAEDNTSEIEELKSRLADLEVQTKIETNLNERRKPNSMHQHIIGRSFTLSAVDVAVYEHFISAFAPILSQINAQKSFRRASCVVPVLTSKVTLSGLGATLAPNRF